MHWAHFLHLYQPAEQQPDILESVVATSYRPLLRGIRDARKARLTMNVNSTLLELFDRYGYRDLIDTLRLLARDERIEFTGSGKYHAMLPLLPMGEARRQIELNTETSRYFLGAAYNPRGFFPPEMAYSQEVGRLVSEMGFRWVLVSEIAYAGGEREVDWTKRYRVQNLPLGVFFRNQRLSNLIMSGVVRGTASLAEATRNERASNGYVITAMDGETFGHHRPGLEKLFFRTLASREMEACTVSELERLYPDVTEASPVASTWASSKQDLEQGVPFFSWRDPENEIHAWQWELTELVLREAYRKRDASKEYEAARRKLDVALASDHFWWASAKPWWSVEMIEDGAYRLLDTLRAIPKANTMKLARARQLYENIISTAFTWQRTGKIRKMAREQHEVTRIPFRDRTVGRGGAEEGVYRAFIDMMQRLERGAAARGEYEAAILWRDALYKLEHKHDIYDAIHAIDLLRTQLPHGEVEDMIEKYKARYRKIRGGQPEQRGA